MANFETVRNDAQFKALPMDQKLAVRDQYVKDYLTPNYQSQGLKPEDITLKVREWTAANRFDGELNAPAVTGVVDSSQAQQLTQDAQEADAAFKPTSLDEPTLDPDPAQITPAPSPQVVGTGHIQKSQGKGWGGALLDIIKGVPAGVFAAVKSTNDLLEQAIPIQRAGAAIKGAITGQGMDAVLADNATADTETQAALDPNTPIGQAVKSMTEFTAGFIGPGRLLKGIPAEGAAAKFLLNSGRSAISDFVAFSGREQNVADMIAEVFGHDNHVADAIDEYLGHRTSAASLITGQPDVYEDTLLSRLKNTLANNVLAMPVGIGAEAIASKLAGQAAKVIESYKNLRKVQEGSPAYFEELKRLADAIDNGEAVDLLSKPPATAEHLTSDHIKQFANNFADRFANKIPPSSDVPLNLSNISQASDVQSGYQALFDTLSERFQDLKRNSPETHDAYLGRVADYLKHNVDNADDLLLQAQVAGEDVDKALIKMLANREFGQALMEQQVIPLSKKFLAGTLDAKGQDLYKQSLEWLSQSAKADVNLGTSAGRILEARKVKPGTVPVFDLITQAGADPKQVAFAIANLDSPDAASHFLNTLAAAAAKGTKITNHFVAKLFYSSSLSGPMTHKFNFEGNLVQSQLRAAYKTVGGAATLQAPIVAEGVAQMLMFWRYMPTALKAAAKSWSINDVAARAGLSQVERQSTKQVLGLVSNPQDSPGWAMIKSIAGLGADAADTVLDIPGRLLISADGLFTHANIAAITYGRALNQGFKRYGTAWHQHIPDVINEAEEAVKHAFDEDLRAIESGFNTDGAITAEAAKSTFATPFTSPIVKMFHPEQNTQGFILDGAQFLAEACSKIPVLGPVLFPFMRVLGNMTTEAYNTIIPILPLLTANGRSQFTAGGVSRASIIGQQIMGLGFLFTGVQMAQGGNITGSPPVDPALRKQKEDLGVKFNSIKFTDPDGTIHWRSFEQLGPVGTYLNFAADLQQSWTYMSQGDIEDAITQAANSIGNQMASRKFTQGLSDVTDLLVAGNDNYSAMDRVNLFLNKKGAALIPFGSLAKTLENDPHLRDAKSFTDSVKQRFASKELEPSRDIFGEPRDNPYAIGEKDRPWYETAAEALGPYVERIYKPNPVDTELKRLASTSGFLLAPFADTKEIEGVNVDLKGFRDSTGQSAADYRRQMMGMSHGKVGTLKDVLAFLISDKPYQLASDDTIISTKLGTQHYKGTKTQIIREVYKAFQDIAEAQLFAIADTFKTADGTSLQDVMVNTSIQKGIRNLPVEAQKAELEKSHIKNLDIPTSGAAVQGPLDALQSLLNP